MRVSLGGLVFCVLTSCAGVEGPDDHDARITRTQPSAIVGGVPSSGASAVVPLGVGGVCTGTLIAPNLVLTARHCVADVVGAASNCDENGETFIDWDAGFVDLTPDAGAFGATHSPQSISFTLTGGAATPRVARVFVAPGATICRSDLALLLLDRAVDDPVIAPIRLVDAPAVGDHLVATGWGFVSGAAYATALQRRDVTVLAQGPTPRVAASSGWIEAVPRNFFSIGEGLCYGDSGSPAFSASGAVVGVASSISRPGLVSPTGTASDCVGSDERGTYEATAAERGFISSVFVAVKATPWLDGQPDPRAQLLEFEAACTSDEQCQSNVCVSGSPTSRCSHGCLHSSCPSGYRCETINERRRCLPSSLPVAALQPHPLAPSGCTTVPGVALPWLLLGALVWRRRLTRMGLHRTLH